MPNERLSHELISALKDLAVELGRTPSRREFEGRVKNAKYTTTKLFGGWTPFCTAAGLEAGNNGKNKKITNAIFERDLEKHLDEYLPRPAAPQAPYPKLAVISDIHWPFVNTKVVEAFYRYLEEKKPDLVVINGDAWDMYSHSKYPRSHNVFTPREEQALARKANEEFWAEVKKRVPNARCVQMLGNHDIRPLKRIIEEYPEAEDWVAEKMKQLFTFDGVETIHDVRQELELGEILIFHGHRSQLGAHRDSTHYSCFNGHTHKGGAVFRRIRGKTLFECNSGLAGDPESKGLTYTPQKIIEWTPGFAACDEWGPRFIPV